MPPPPRRDSISGSPARSHADAWTIAGGCLLCAAMLPPAAARDAESPAAPETTAGANAPLPLWELGLYTIAGWQPAYPGSDQNLTNWQLLPYGIYRGSVLRVEGGGVGVRALQTPRFEWDASASGSFGSSANRVRAREGMADIGTLVQLGPALRINLGDLIDPLRNPRLTRLEFPVRAVFDATEDLGYKGWTFEPRFSHTAWQGASSSAVVSASMLFGSRSINDLFYGVAPIYATPQRPEYVARAGLISTNLSALFRHRLSPRFQLTLFANAETVKGNANHASPLVLRDQNYGFGAALSWAIYMSDAKGSD